MFPKENQNTLSSILIFIFIFFKWGGFLAILTGSVLRDHALLSVPQELSGVPGIEPKSAA